MSSIAKAVHAFSGEGQTVPLPLAESVVVLVAERNQDGWCRGFSAGREGWFPASYVKYISESTLTKVSAPQISTTRNRPPLCDDMRRIYKPLDKAQAIE